MIWSFRPFDIGETVRVLDGDSAGRIEGMSTRVGLLSAVIACAPLLVGCGSVSPHGSVNVPALRAVPSHSSHIVEIVMENKEAGDVLGNRQAPFVNRLARRYGAAQASYAITHPSLPNYLALTSGSTHGIASDCTDCHVAGQNLIDQLEAAGVSWKAYMEDLPRPCFAGARYRGYAKKHDPFLYYDDIAASRARCAKVVSFGRLVDDLSAGTLPTFSFLSPNLCHDTHDCAVSSGDRFLARIVPRLLAELGPHGVLVLTWDEGRSVRGCCAGSHGGRIPTIVAGPDVRPGARVRIRVDHYGVLHTIEKALGLPALAAAADPSHGDLEGLFRRSVLRRARRTA